MISASWGGEELEYEGVPVSERRGRCSWASAEAVTDGWACMITASERGIKWTG